MGNEEEIRKIRKEIKALLLLARKHLAVSMAIMHTIQLSKDGKK